ncbi:uncharacterized protein EMH_0069570 [Eimeria mitis]|uniref:Uncharacterized protein n=1 Tax=Eimeria mitis TaxID=44415 RepID=U6KDZ0_9EIME|nr:uncharacterized protein EMH_0069570 [Eimeria mitis]CDJ34996.1 hypothetical protein, conserved [Eimeria mitis]
MSASSVSDAQEADAGSFVYQGSYSYGKRNGNCAASSGLHRQQQQQQLQQPRSPQQRHQELVAARREQQQQLTEAHNEWRWAERMQRVAMHQQQRHLDCDLRQVQQVHLSSGLPGSFQAQHRQTAGQTFCPHRLASIYNLSIQRELEEVRGHLGSLLCRASLRGYGPAVSGNAIRRCSRIKEALARVEDDLLLLQELQARYSNAHSPEWGDDLHQRQLQRLVPLNLMPCMSQRIDLQHFRDPNADSEEEKECEQWARTLHQVLLRQITAKDNHFPD